MRFVDEITLEVSAGRGGDGSTAMRREKYQPLGGPAGGDGGDGGDVVLQTDTGLSTLYDLKYRKQLRAKDGEHGRGKDQYGKRGEELVVRVPVGTQVFDAESGELLADLDAIGERFVAAAGGRGGRGNIHFATPSDRAPLRAEKGEPGQHRKLRIELKLLADVGIVGFPNVGKSTLISVVSKARPKVADYPFTTLVPSLGVVSRGDERSFVVADIPGLIEGAAEGAGLGHRFLKHVERTRVLLILVSVDPDPERSPASDYKTLRRELERFDPELAARPFVVGMSKQDLPEAREALSAFKRSMKRKSIEVVPFSAATREGVETLLDRVEALLDANPLPAKPRAEPLAKGKKKR
ncbi:MAG TPA: GTPase ObgE [Polyangiales bacterium]|nr:GTPase ObgE [Polyangiales bacterium]